MSAPDARLPQQPVTNESSAARRLTTAAGLRTGTLLFLILSIALAPIGIIGVNAALTQLQRGDAERQALLDASTREQAQNLASRIRSDRILLTETLRRRGDVPSGERCRTILGLFPGLNVDVTL